MDNEVKLYLIVLILVVLLGLQWWEDDHASH